jgi:hypothetical protein
MSFDRPSCLSKLARSYSMVRASFKLACSLLVFHAGCSVHSHSTEPHVPTRPVVLYSPHTDNGTVWTYGYSTMECPGGRPRFEGYPTTEIKPDGHSQLLFRVTGSSADHAEGAPIRDVRLRLTHRLYPAVAELSEDSMHAAITDATGAAVLNVLPGIYRADVSLIGYVEGAAVLRVRPRAVDSVRVVLTTEAIC